MYYSFNSEIAEVYGVDEAIFLNNMLFWVSKNKANNQNYHDGYYWTYNSQKALAELFPFWNEDKIRRIIKKLKDQGVLLVGNYNKLAYDRTGWYSINEDLINGRKPHPAKMRNGKDENAGTIPDINPDIKENILKEKHPTSNSGFGCKTITENAEQEESIVIQDSIFTQDNNTPLENNNTVNARQGNEYNGKESKSSDISREKAIVNWNRIASNYGLCEIRTITDTRFSKLKARVKQAGGWQEFWNIVNEAIQESKFLRGEKGWKADFDFCLQPSSFVKLMEKTYK